MLSIRRILARRPLSRPARRTATAKARPSLESLEARVVLYSASGNLWPHPQLVTISFMPDGTDLGGLGSNLFASFNSNPRLGGQAQWQAQILKAAQVWAQRTNINFAVVPDNGAPSGGGSDQQGDPGFGDIRIGGYDFGNSSLARAYQPPPVNNFSIAGDIAFNTGQTFTINSAGYDLFTVAVHEIGHALGLYHTSATAAEMFPYYTGIKPNLNADDIAGIQSIYGGARGPDAYNSGGASNGSFATAADLSSLIDPVALTALVPDLDLNTASQAEYFKFTAPAGTPSGATLKLNVQSSGLSLLSPKVTVYAADQTTVLATISALNQYGTTIAMAIPGASAGQTYYVKVQGADSTAFSTGDYAMTINFGTGPSPTVPLPQTQTPDGNPITAGGGLADTLPDDGPGHHHHHHHFPRGPRIHGAKAHHGRHHSAHHSG